MCFIQKKTTAKRKHNENRCIEEICLYIQTRKKENSNNNNQSIYIYR